MTANTVALSFSVGGSSGFFDNRIGIPTLLHGLAIMAYVPGKVTNMSKNVISNIVVKDDIVTFDVIIHGQVKDQAARTNWTIADMNLGLTGNAVGLKTLLEGYVASGHYWIKIQGWLRKCSREIVQGFVGTTMSWLAFKTTVAAALPKGQDKTELLGELQAKDAYIAKLRAQLKALGMTDAQIEEALME